MTERPILFQAPMILAILDGRKTQTRRVMKPQPDDDAIITVGEIGTSRGAAYIRYPMEGGVTTRIPCRHGQPGDRLWVRESMRFDPDQSWRYEADGDDIINQDYGKNTPVCPSIHMPRSCSRILLEITGIRVERLQDISERDAWAEGCEGFDDDVSGGKSGYREFCELWESINGAGAWAANPWVWVIEFRRIGA